MQPLLHVVDHCVNVCVEGHTWRPIFPLIQS
jgi:hypothetical protein